MNVIFDMDGLMFDTEKVFIMAWDYAGEKIGIGKVGYLTDAGIIDCFSVIVCGDMVEKSKPAPDIYLKACEMLNENSEIRSL